MSTAISVEGISKLYRLGEIGTGSLAHDVNRWWHKARGKEDPYLKVGQSNNRTIKGDSDYVYAIKDVSFEVKQGEVLGIIGRNGAGKSTLLKILSRVTTPTNGQVKVRGRIASLLEVGTGFHPELTGRENIYLNGAILGMRKAEIRSKFDEIVQFSGCERYIDTPVKRYSSGMYVRLAFAVAAHLESEILIVDEVLAVGDAEFQKKCLGKMKDVAGNGRTVLFVSHNLTAVRYLCTTGLLLNCGRSNHRGDAREVITRYIEENTISSCLWQRDEIKPPKSDEVFFERVSVCNFDGKAMSDFACDEKFLIRIELTATAEIPKIQVGIRVTNHEGVPAFTTCNTDESQQYKSLSKGKVILEAKFDSSYFMPGSYTLKIIAHVPREKVFDLIEDELSFNIHDVGENVNVLKDDRLGVLCPSIPWSKNYQNS
jgi:lipopolysaccharide transport system ATP-binding protein